MASRAMLHPLKMVRRYAQEVKARGTQFLGDVEVGRVGAGNCVEYAALAFDYLEERASFPVDYVWLAPSQSHVFVVANQQTPPKKTTIHIRTTDLEVPAHPLSFVTWDSGAWICDAWSNIACEARLYTGMWCAKMSKWHDRGRTIQTDWESGFGWGSPTRAEWLFSIAQNQKVIGARFAPRP